MREDAIHPPASPGLQGWAFFVHDSTHATNLAWWGCEGGWVGGALHGQGGGKNGQAQHSTLIQSMHALLPSCKARTTLVCQ